MHAGWPLEGPWDECIVHKHHPCPRVTSEIKRITKSCRLQERHVLQHTFVLLEFEVLLTVDICESPLLGDDNLLTTGELVTGTAESLLDDMGVVVLAADGEDNLADVDPGNRAIWLAPGTTHTGLEPRSKSIRGQLYQQS